MKRFSFKLAQVVFWVEYETINTGGQEVKDQGHTIDAEDRRTG